MAVSTTIPAACCAPGSSLTPSVPDAHLLVRRFPTLCPASNWKGTIAFPRRRTQPRRLGLPEIRYFDCALRRRGGRFVLGSVFRRRCPLPHGRLVARTFLRLGCPDGLGHHVQQRLLRGHETIHRLARQVGQNV